jgi:hypothetical protein
VISPDSHVLIISDWDGSGVGSRDLNEKPPEGTRRLLGYPVGGYGVGGRIAA